MDTFAPQKYYVYLENQEHGPFEIGELEKLVTDCVATRASLARAVDSLQKIPLGDILNDAKRYESEAKRKKFIPRIYAILFVIFFMLFFALFFGFYNRIKSVESYIDKHQEDQKSIFSTESKNAKSAIDVELSLIKEQLELIKINVEKNRNSHIQAYNSSSNLYKELNQRISNISDVNSEAIQKFTISNVSKLSEIENRLIQLDLKNKSIEKASLSFPQIIDVVKNDVAGLEKRQFEFKSSQDKHREWIERLVEELKKIKDK